LTGTLVLAQLSQEEIREKILHTWESAKHSWVIPIHIGPVDISITKAVWFLFIGAAITFLILFVGSRLLKNRPGAYQVIVEDLYGFGRNLGGQVGEEGRKWFPYTLTLFVFILTLNLIGLIPSSYPVTSNISFTLTLAILTFILTQYEGFKRNGVVPYFKSFVPPGLPWKPLMVPFMWFIEVLGEFTKPLTLGMRGTCSSSSSSASSSTSGLSWRRSRYPWRWCCSRSRSSSPCCKLTYSLSLRRFT
jgi:F-type H+-transporting ATPase subunit a